MATSTSALDVEGHPATLASQAAVPRAAGCRAPPRPAEAEEHGGERRPGHGDEAQEQPAAALGLDGPDPVRGPEPPLRHGAQRDERCPEHPAEAAGGLAASIRFAAEVGASGDDLAAASGLPAERVRRIVERGRARDGRQA